MYVFKYSNTDIDIGLLNDPVSDRLCKGSSYNLHVKLKCLNDVGN